MLAMDHSPRKASPTPEDERFARIRGRMRVPLIAAPMFRVSGVDLVVGVLNVSNGSFAEEGIPDP